MWNGVGANSVRQQINIPLSAYGLSVETAINNISKNYQNVTVDKYVIMPNHIHIIILLQENDGRTLLAPTISNIVKQMKENVTKCIGISFWQRSFHDHIIRNEQDYQKIWEYIDTNPVKWETDCFFVEQKTRRLSSKSDDSL